MNVIVNVINYCLKITVELFTKGIYLILLSNFDYISFT